MAVLKATGEMAPEFGINNHVLLSIDLLSPWSSLLVFASHDMFVFSIDIFVATQFKRVFIWNS